VAAVLGAADLVVAAPGAAEIEEMIKRSQDRIRQALPGGVGGGRALILVLVVLLLLWGASGFYRVQPDEQGVVLQFGEWVSTTESGLRWHLPFPIETVIKPKVERLNSIDVGFRSAAQGAPRSSRDIAEESLMLTGDQNIIDIDFTIFWKISDAGLYLFKIRDPEATVKIAAESAMREIIGRTEIQRALSEDRQAIEISSRELLQTILNEYESGIEVTQVQLQDVQPPRQVADAFIDVKRAEQDRTRLRNEAEAYRNDVLPRARGEAQRMIQDANAYRERLINEAQGEAQRFLNVYEAYLENPDVTKRRMYIETLESVYARTNKVIMGKGTEGVVPYLPLNELKLQSGGRSSNN
jgi:membrane protease subunit HflK